jgi:hypothetical protein
LSAGIILWLGAVSDIDELGGDAVLGSYPQYLPMKVGVSG